MDASRNTRARPTASAGECAQRSRPTPRLVCRRRSDIGAAMPHRPARQVENPASRKPGLLLDSGRRGAPCPRPCPSCMRSIRYVRLGFTVLISIDEVTGQGEEFRPVEESLPIAMDSEKHPPVTRSASTRAPRLSHRPDVPVARLARRGDREIAAKIESCSPARTKRPRLSPAHFERKFRTDLTRCPAASERDLRLRSSVAEECSAVSP